MTHTQTQHRGRRLRQTLLVPAVVMALMTSAAPAGAAHLVGRVGMANSAQTTSVASQHSQATSHSPLRFQAFLRKVG